MQDIQESTSGDLCPVFCDGKKLTGVQQAVLWNIFVREPARPTGRVLTEFAADGEPLVISVRHVNRLRSAWGLQRRKGRPRGETKPGGHGGPGAVSARTESGGLVQVTPSLTYVGVHVFAAWLDEQGLWAQVVPLMRQSIERYQAEHPDAAFALLAHKDDTLLHRFQALLYAPLFHIGKLTGYDVIEHALETLIGCGYQSSTLTQFLAQLERINAGDALLPALLPKATEGRDETGRGGESRHRIYIDGHMIGLWSTVSMHKGKITMLGRIMAGSQAIIAHNQNGQAICVAYQPPDIRMPHFILEYCQQIVATTGVNVFVIDREANAVELARTFHNAGLGLLSMLDRNQYDGLSSWHTTRIGDLTDGSAVYEGQWAIPREDDPRHFVLVDTGERVLAYWGTPTVKQQIDPEQWPDVYRQRTHLQEQRFKEMKAYEALDINFGTKKVWGPDRHQERKREKLAEVTEKKAQQVTKKTSLLTQQQAKVAESQRKGHTKRLDQRQRRFTALEQELTQVRDNLEQAHQKLDALGPENQRADRDFRKQLIMTIRTLLLDNALQAFLTALIAIMPASISLTCLLTVFFERSGARVETETEVMYWVNTTGLSVAYRNTLTQIATALCAMKLTCRGKLIRVRLRERSP
jgi:hypothetical protein